MSEEKRGAQEPLSMKERAIEEFKVYWVITLYLALFLGAFTVYRRLILAEFGVAYLHYGVALVEAMVIGKIILIGKAFGLGRRFEDGPLVLSVLHKSALFAAFAFLFGFVEHVIEGLYHRKDWATIMQGFADLGIYELIARLVMLIVAFIPFFAFWEIGRVLGWQRISALFFSRR